MSGEPQANPEEEVSSGDAAELITQAVSYLQPGATDADGEQAARPVMSAAAVNAIPVEIQVVIGSATLAVSDLLKLGQGATLQLDQLIGEPVDICVNGARVARGELFVPDADPDHIAVRIVDIENS